MKDPNLFKKIINIGNRNIVIGGIGKSFYQDGLPLSISIPELIRKGFDVSILHIVDEFIRNGWSTDTILSKLKEEVSDGGLNVDLQLIKSFCESSYEDQRSMIFESLFSDVEMAKKWLKSQLIKE